MPKLLLKFRDSVLKEIPIKKTCVIIGRTGENDIVINNLGVSRQHAKIFKDGEDFIAEDLGSRNGTLLNEHALDQARLQDKDEIVIGKHTLVFLQFEGDDELEDVSPVNLGMESSSLSPEETLRLGKATTQPVPKFNRDAHIKTEEVGVEIIEGAMDQSKIVFQRLLVVAGKGPKVDIKVKGEYEKDVVFVISNRPYGYVLSPPKGIELKVNEKNVVDYVTLKDGDIIQAAETKMKFYIRQ